MIVARSEHPMWLSNSYLVAEGAGGSGVLVDANGLPEPLIEGVEADSIEVTHMLLTHHHFDHVEGARELADHFEVPILAHPICAGLLGPGIVDQAIQDGDVVTSGSMPIEVIATPGHCADHLALLADDTDLLTADLIFRHTVGGTQAKGATGFADLRASIMDEVMTLPPATRIHPGHSGPTTVGEEWENNGFVRIWRGEDPEGLEPCRFHPPTDPQPQDATLILWAPDYDGTNKAWIRFPDGRDEVVGGSRVERLG